MQFLHSIVAILTLFAYVRAEVAEPTPPPQRAAARVSMGEARLFSGEDVQLTCSVPGDPLSNWRYQWFLNGVSVHASEVYDLKSTRVQQRGVYTCQGEKAIEAWPYSVMSLQSDPITVHVDGGWALLRTPPEHLLIDEVLTLSCRVRGDRMLTEVVFYKDGVQIQKQNHKDLVFPKVTLEDQGSYWCRATWLQNSEYHSAQSIPASVTVLDKVTTPVLELEEAGPVVQEGEKVVLRCVTQLNAREKDVTIEYYFMKNGNRVQPGSSRNSYVISGVDKEDEGFYSCKARVRALNVERLSEEVELIVHSKEV